MIDIWNDMKIRPLLLAYAAMCAGAPAFAQDDVVVMRRMIANPKLVRPPVTNPTDQPTPATPTPATPTPTTPTPTEGGGTPTPTVTPDPTATPTPTTPTPLPEPVGRWQPAAYVATAPSCSAAAPATRTATCVDTVTSETLPEAYCHEAKPATAGTVADYSTCTYDWIYGPYGEYSGNCAANVTRSREATGCLRNEIPEPVATTFCTKGKNLVQTVDNYTGCAGSWIGTTGSCQSGNKAPTTFTCQVSGQVVTADKCDPTARPADYSGTCSGTWTHYYTTCTSANVNPDIVRCVDEQGATIDDSRCNPETKPAAAPRTCPGTWTSVPGTCISGSQTPVSSCVSSTGGALADGNCNPSTKPGAQACSSVTCGTPTVNHYYSGGTIKVLPGPVTSATAAFNACNTYVSTNASEGVCLYNSTNALAYLIAGGTLIDRVQSNLYASTCKAK